MKYPSHLLKLIHLLKRLPGVGTKSAERFAFQLLLWQPKQLQEFAEVISGIETHLIHCDHCGCLIESKNTCTFCDQKLRKTDVICIIASPKDAFAIEETREYKGLYHVLGGVLSPLASKGPEQLAIAKLKERIKNCQIVEVIIALDSTLEGDTTALYIKQELEPLNLQISRLAFGLPMGSSLDYIDGGTLARALSDRRGF